MMYVLRPGIMEKVVFAWAMGYLCFGHIYRLCYDYGGYTLDITGSVKLFCTIYTLLIYTLLIFTPLGMHLVLNIVVYYYFLTNNYRSKLPNLCGSEPYLGQSSSIKPSIIIIIINYYY